MRRVLRKLNETQILKSVGYQQYASFAVISLFSTVSTIFKRIFGGKYMAGKKVPVNAETTTNSHASVSFTYPDAARIKAEIHVLQILHLILTAAVVTMLLL